MSAYETARTKTGNNVLLEIRDSGLDVASEKLEGTFAACALALVAIHGRQLTYEIFRDVLGGIPGNSKPMLIVDNDVPNQGA